MKIEIHTKLVAFDKYLIQLKFTDVFNFMHYVYGYSSKMHILTYDNLIYFRYYQFDYLLKEINKKKPNKWFTIMSVDEIIVVWQFEKIKEKIDELNRMLELYEKEEFTFLTNKFRNVSLNNIISIPTPYEEFCKYAEDRKWAIGVLTKDMRVRYKQLQRKYIVETIFSKLLFKYFYKPIKVSMIDYQYEYTPKRIRLLDTKYTGEEL